MAWLGNKKTKFKVGDKVRAVRGTEGYYPFLGVLNREGVNNNVCGVVLYSECKAYKEGDHFCLDAKHFELAEDTKFKVGDRVKHKSLYIGKEFTIDRMGEDGYICALSDISLGAFTAPYFKEHFELVTDSKSESELERLVRKANEGAEAEDRIATYYLDRVEASPSNQDNYRLLKERRKHTNYVSYRYKVKQGSKFESFTVGNNWEVKFSSYCNEEILSIGCKAFNAKDLWYALENLTKDSTAQNVLKDGTNLSAMRNGIVCNGKESITWSEAEKIRDALERVLS